MMCDYAILKVTRYNIESIYESELKYLMFELYVKEFLGAHIANIDRKTVFSISENMVPIIHKKGFIFYKDDDAIYVFCKLWTRNCDNCDKEDWALNKVYKIFNRRLCLGCAYEQLVPEIIGASGRVIFKEELLKQLLPNS